MAITQKELVLDHMRMHGSITDIEAFNLYGICRLSARIHELRNDGHTIETEFVKSKNRYGKRVAYGCYKIAH